MNKQQIYLILVFLLLVLITGCTQEDTYLIKKNNLNTFNNFYADGISCFGYTGLNLTGSDGSTGRSIDLNNFPIIIMIDNNFLNSVYDYGVSVNYNITFNSFVWNDQDLTICLATSNTTLSNSVYLGINATGGDGDVNRVLQTNISSPLLVSVDNQPLNSGVDYSNNLGNITFISWLYNDAVISVWG